MSFFDIFKRKYQNYSNKARGDALERIGKLTDIDVHPILPMQEPWRYRNKAQFPVGQTDGVLSQAAIGSAAMK